MVACRAEHVLAFEKLNMGGGGSTPQLPKGSPPAASPSGNEEASGNPVSNQPWYTRRGLAFRRFLTGESKVDYLAEEIALGWKSADPNIRDLLVLLAAKWQAEREDAKRASFIAAISFLAGIATLGVAIFVLWTGRAHSTELIDRLMSSASGPTT